MGILLSPFVIGETQFRQALITHFYEHPGRPRVVFSGDQNKKEEKREFASLGQRHLCICLLEGRFLGYLVQNYLCFVTKNLKYIQ